jgi:outer membrane scaffolding protein for murein synthesis (MipA/OmpV family)
MMISVRKSAWHAAAGGLWLALLCAAPGAALAADASPFNPLPVGEWIVSIGGTAQVGPSYEGANSARLGFIPSISWRRAGEPRGFSAPDDSFDYALVEQGGFSAGPVANFRAGRYYSDEHDLFGLRKIPWTLELGGFAQYWLLPDAMRARVELRQGLHGHHGLVADFALDGVQRFGRFQFSLGPRMTLASNAFMEKNFGISAADAAMNGRVVPFNPGGGIKSIGVMLASNYDWNDAWNTGVFARYDRLLGDAAKSGVVATLGQRDQLTVGLTLVHSFKIGF